jgi:putative ABC transport system permease protein
MSILKLLLAEIRYRKLNFLLSLLAIIVAVTLFVAGPVLIDGYGHQTQDDLAQLENETRKLMIGMGFNLMIVNRNTDMSNFWAEDFATEDMPQEYIDRLARDERLTLVTHLVATLQEKRDWQNRKVLVVGYLPETPQPHKPATAFAKRWGEKRRPLGPDIAPGTVSLGHELGVGKKVGETIEVKGEQVTKQFKIARIWPEKGSKDDITIAMNLSDAQELLNKPGKINQIMALGCQCSGERLPKIRQQLADVLPETRVTEFESIALARAEQRDAVKQSRQKVQGTLQTLAGVMTPVVVLASAIWVGLLALANVRERRAEIGLFRALGKGSGVIASLFLGKAVLLGLLGAGVGFSLGTWLAHWLGVRILEVPAAYFSVDYGMLLVALFGAPLLSAVASYLPAVSALTQDPAVVLRDH